MRKALTLGSTSLVAVALAAVGTPAQAADSVATFSLVGGAGSGLSISAPASQTPVDLGSATTGTLALAGTLGNVTVTDTRGSLVATWTATVGTTVFTTGTATANETVAAAAIRYTSNAPLVSNGGTGVVTPGTAALTMASPGTAATFAGIGNNTTTWNPTISFTLLPTQVAGTYTGTITHSVL